MEPTSSTNCTCQAWANLNDPADGRPKRAPMSEDELAWFLTCGVVEQNPTLPLASLEHEAAVIRYNVRLHGTEVLRGQMSELLNSELEGYRIYSMSKHPDNLALWAKYAGNHCGYCLEFRNEVRYVHAPRKSSTGMPQKSTLRIGSTEMGTDFSVNAQNGPTKKRFGWCRLAERVVRSQSNRNG